MDTIDGHSVIFPTFSDMFSFFRKFIIASEREELLPEDKANFETLSTSLLCKSLEKKLRNRMRDRRDNVVRYVKEGNPAQAIVFASQEEELADILLEFENSRKDIASRLKTHG